MVATDKPAIPDVIDRFHAYYRAHCQPYGSWHNLHVVLDDRNVAEHHVRFCRERALNEGDTEGAELADILLRMSKTQRAKLGDMAADWTR